MMVALAIAALAGAGMAMRFLLVADDDGIWVRRLFSEQLVEWPDLSTIDVVQVHANTPTLRITRVSGTHIDVPPTLVQPTLPTGMKKARTLVAAVAQRLLAIAAEKRG